MERRGDGEKERKGYREKVKRSEIKRRRKLGNKRRRKCNKWGIKKKDRRGNYLFIKYNKNIKNKVFQEKIFKNL